MDSYKIRNLSGTLLPFMLSAFSVFSISMVVDSLSSYLDVPISAILLSIPIDFIGGAIGAIVLGHGSDRIGRKPVMIISAVLFSTGMIAAAFMRSLYELYIIWFIIGIGVNSQNGISYPLLVETLRRSTGSIGGTMQGLYFLGFLLDFLFYFVFPFWRYYFLAAGIFSLIVSVSSASMIVEPARHGGRVTGGGKISGRLAYYTVAFSLVVIGAFMLSVPLMSVAPTLLSYLKIPEAFIIVLSILGFLGFVAAGYISDRIPRWKTTVFFSSSAMILGIAIYFLNLPFVILAVLALIYVSSGFFSFTGIWVSENYPARMRATATNIVFFVGRILGGFSPFIVILIDPSSLKTGMSVMIMVSAFIAIAGASLFVFASGIPENKSESV